MCEVLADSRPFCGTSYLPLELHSNFWAPNVERKPLRFKLSGEVKIV